MMLLPDPNALRRAERDLRDTAERARRLRAARRRGREVSIRDLLPPRDVGPASSAAHPRGALRDRT
jgi:hypothetical protein